MDKEDIKNWLKNYNINYYEICDNNIVNVNQSVYIVNKNIDELPFKFGIVKGDFNVNCNNLTNCNNFPVEVYGYVSCGNNKITSLEGFTKKCNSISLINNKLKNLNGLEIEEISYDFCCSNNQITDIKSSIKKVGNFDCNHNKISDVSNFPEKIYKSLSMLNNPITLENLIEMRCYVGIHIYNSLGIDRSSVKFYEYIKQYKFIIEEKQSLIKEIKKSSEKPQELTIKKL